LDNFGRFGNRCCFLQNDCPLGIAAADSK